MCKHRKEDIPVGKGREEREDSQHDRQAQEHSAGTGSTGTGSPAPDRGYEPLKPLAAGNDSCNVRAPQY